MFRSIIRQQRRFLHQVPRLTNESQVLAQGVEGLFTPKAIQIGWTDYQKYLITKLTMLTMGTDFETKNSFQILQETVKSNQLSPVFHYASQSHNNHLFYEQLINKSENNSKISQELEKRVIEKYGSLEGLRGEILTEADLLNGQGWIFLVEKSDKSLDIISCQNEGTPYYFGRNQSLDLNGPIHMNDYTALNEMTERVANGEPDYNLPLLLINCWDFAYLNDYGINGRADYLEQLWDCINWDVINNRVFSWNRLSEYL